MITRKDYERAARYVRKTYSKVNETKEAGSCRASVVRAFIVFFSEDNSRFNVERFRAACIDEDAD